MPTGSLPQEDAPDPSAPEQEPDATDLLPRGVRDFTTLWRQWRRLAHDLTKDSEQGRCDLDPDELRQFARWLSSSGLEHVRQHADADPATWSCGVRQGTRGEGACIRSHMLRVYAGRGAIAAMDEAEEAARAGNCDRVQGVRLAFARGMRDGGLNGEVELAPEFVPGDELARGGTLGAELGQAALSLGGLAASGISLSRRERRRNALSRAGGATGDDRVAQAALEEMVAGAAWTAMASGATGSTLHTHVARLLENDGHPNPAVSKEVSLDTGGAAEYDDSSLLDARDGPEHTQHLLAEEEVSDLLKVASPKQKQILHLLLHGHTRAEVVTLLRIKRSTVDVQMHRLNKKFIQARS